MLLISLVVLIIGVVMLLDRDATFQQVFRGIFLVVLAVVVIISITISHGRRHDKKDCLSVHPASHLFM